MMPRFHMDTVMQNKTVPVTAVWAITPNGVKLGSTLIKKIDGASLFVTENLMAQKDDTKGIYSVSSLSDEIKKQFFRFSAHIFIFATGIAVRMIAPLISSKITDPAIVVVDDRAVHAISLLSGHLGGANELTQMVADILDCRPVVTTATDVNQVPAIDMIAKKKDLFIETPENIKRVNMAFLKGEPVCVHDPHQILTGEVLSAVAQTNLCTEAAHNHIYCSYRKQSVSRETLVLRPRILCVGIGCNRGTSCEEIQRFLLEVLESENLANESIFSFGTTALKKDEQGLNQLSEKMGIPLVFYNKAELNSVDTIKNPSNMVQKHIGVRSVCEAAAILTADNGELIVPKKKNRDVTVAVAIKR